LTHDFLLELCKSRFETAVAVVSFKKEPEVLTCFLSHLFQKGKMFVSFITCENCGRKDTPERLPAFHNQESTPCAAGSFPQAPRTA
jgi:hypothetical protein